METLTEPKRIRAARFHHTLGVLGDTPHYRGPDGTPWAYEPYVREMRVWMDLFAHVRICSPAGEGPMRGNKAPFERTNFEWRPVPYCLTCGAAGMRNRIVQLPRAIAHVARTIRETDFILVRSPGHLSLVGAAMLRSLNKPSITKWAGENGAYQNERLPSRMDRILQSIPSHRHPVLVYGPAKRPHQVSFLPALMSSEELQQAREISADRRWVSPWQILSVGRLVPVKGFDLAIRALGELRRNRPELDWNFTLVGDGTARQSLEALARECGIADWTTFTGALPFQQVQEHYAAAHVAIMPGIKEGWPKIIAEAWAHGTIPVAASAGLVPWILQDENAGVVFKPNPAALADALARLLQSPLRMHEMSEGLYCHADELSLEQFQARLERVLVQRCALR